MGHKHATLSSTAQAEHRVQPDRARDDPRQKAMVGAQIGIKCRPAILSQPDPPRDRLPFTGYNALPLMAGKSYTRIPDGRTLS